MKLLLVDDEPGIREGLAMLLRRRGHEVVSVGDCAQAAHEQARGGFAAVISDWRLPDGVASQFLRECQVPVICLSGHPEEVSGVPSMVALLTKPIAPRALCEQVEALAASSNQPVPQALPKDVAAVVQAARTLLAPGAQVHDDGTFVTVVGVVPVDCELDRLRALGGDLRLRLTHEEQQCTGRWFRDGRPRAQLHVIKADAPWPVLGELAVDFDGVPASEALFAQVLAQTATRLSRHERVHFLNAPESLHSWALSHGRTDVMPMRGAIGPFFPAELADLWSEP